MPKRCWSVLVLIALSVLAPVGAQDGVSFHLLRGRAALSRTGGSTWLELGPEPVAVAVRDMLRTEGESRGELKFPDGRLFRLDAGSVVTVQADGALMQVGSCWFKVPKQGQAFQVTTPSTTCGVLGTVFDVAVDRYGRTTVRVFEGIVSVRARDDQRHRQIVLQRGMQTTVRDRGFTGDQVQKFDPGAVESEQNQAWGRGGPSAPPPVAFPKIPSRTPTLPVPAPTGLPPIRPTLPGSPQPLWTDGAPFSPGTGAESGEESREEEAAPTDVRSRLTFFENLREQRLRDRQSQQMRSGPDSGEAWRQPYPGRPYGPDGVPLTRDMLQEGHGRPFGEATPAPTGIQDERQLREWIAEIQNRLIQVHEEAAKVTAELAALQTQAAPGSRAMTGRSGRPAGGSRPAVLAEPAGSPGISPSQIRERFAQLQSRLGELREQQRKLFIRMTDLRNRLR